MVLVTKGTGGDLVPFLAIGSALKGRGHDVTLLSHCFYEGAARKAGFNFATWDTLDEFERFIDDIPLLHTPQGLPAFFRQHILPTTLVEYDLIRAHCRLEDTVLIARHASSIAAQMVAEKLDIPFVSVFTAVAQATTVSILGEFYRHILAADVNQARAQAGLPPVDDWHAWLRYPQRSIATWPDWFAAPESSWPAGVVPIGFVMHDGTETGELPEQVQEILEDDVPPVLITGGTGIWALEAKFYRVSAEVCRLLSRQALLVTRYERLVPSDLPVEVTWFKYLPFASLMPHVEAIIHHGGTSVLVRAMAEGIPQLALAQGGDRPDTAVRLERLGVAKALLPSQWQPDVMAATFCDLMASSVVQARCRELAQRLRDADPMALACEVIESALENGKGWVK
jgi:rhamnosyltransferase subunit B